jgi:thiol-disulfide isomerase/thioredoxin
MKKTYALLLLFILSSKPTFAQVNIGQVIEDMPIPKLLNTKSTFHNIDQLKGKVIWLEFWATWCSPCIKAMSHLQKLQKAYAGKLQVIAISTEKEKRILQFIKNQRSDLWFAVDTANTFSKSFPYQVIPHSILIDAGGEVIAITNPEKITSQLIADVLAGKRIDLPLKADVITQDPWGTYFGVVDKNKGRFTMLPKIDGLASSSRSYKNDSTFKDRRISMINISLELAYRIAYGGLP